MADGQLVTPPVPDLACVGGETVAEVVEWLTHYYEDDGCPWNYRTGTKSIKAGYRGLHRLDLLLASCAQERTKQGRTLQRRNHSACCPTCVRPFYAGV